MKIKILRGLPGSGKTTWAKEFCSKNKDWIRVNRDDLRNMRGEYWIPKQEDVITDMENACIWAALSRGYNVILDSTNLNLDRNKDRVSKLKEKFPQLEYETKFFDVPIEQCIKNDLKRPNSVGDKVIKEMYNKYFGEPVNVYTEDPKLPHVIIVDIDGTLAIKGDRSPYDWDRVGEDIVNEPVKNIVTSSHFRGGNISTFIFTGRDEVCREQTNKWLKDNGIPFNKLCMRPAGDSRKDSIVKKEMFDKYISGKYYIEFVLDDRQQVVDMWRKELGLTCLQVDYGDF